MWNVTEAASNVSIAQLNFTNNNVSDGILNDMDATLNDLEAMNICRQY
jgi:hypothetical protein